MSLNALKATGTILRFRVHGTSDPFVPIAELLDVSGPSEKTTFLDATSHDDTAEAVVASGITRFDEMTFPVNFIPTDASHDHITGLRYHRRNKTKLDIEMEHTDGTVDAFVAFCSKCSPTAPVDGILKGEFGLRLTSDIGTT